MHECGPQRECSVESVNSVNAKVTSQTWKYEDLFRCRRTNSCPARAALVGTTTMAAPAAAAQAVAQQLLTGLDQGSSSSKRKPRQTLTADRSAIEWQCVTIEAEHDINPTVACKFCPWTGTAGATRVRNHILCTGGVAKCKGSGDEYEQMKAKLLNKKEGKKAAMADQLAVPGA